jgi:glutamate transport system permease protein
MSSSIDQMFDPPGPRGRRMMRITSLIALIGLVAIVTLVLYLFYLSGGLDAQKWVIFTKPGALALLLAGLHKTLNAAFSAGIIALVFGSVLALLRLSKNPWIRGVLGVYVEVTRSLPTLLVLYFTVLILPYYQIRIPVYWQLVLALVITNGAMISEILRACLLNVPSGQVEASLSLGLTRPQAYVSIIFPQAFRAAMPALVAQVIYLLKGTVLGYVISYEELLYNARIIGEFTGFILQSYLVISLVYLILNIILSRVAFWLEERITTHSGSSPLKGPSPLKVEGYNGRYS